MNFTTEQIAALTILIGAFSAAAVAIIAALKANTVAIASVDAKTDTIKHSVDGHATSQQTKIEALERHIAVLVEVLAKQDQSAALLAQSRVREVVARNTDAQTRASDLVPTAKEQLDVQKEIAQNTATTAENTDPTRK